MDAIHKVVEEGDLRQTKNLLDRRKYAMSRDKNGVSLLHKAVMNGRTDVAEYLASNYPEILNLTDAVSNWQRCCVNATQYSRSISRALACGCSVQSIKNK